MSLPAGRRLGLYEILAPIGAGGMGEDQKAVLKMIDALADRSSKRQAGA